MITRDNFKKLLTALGFTQNGDVFAKYFSAFDGHLKADFANGLLLYPEDRGLNIVGRTTCNFLQNENFVVFECVNRLFEKGIIPNTWNLSRNGRSDTAAAADGPIFW